MRVNYVVCDNCGCKRPLAEALCLGWGISKEPPLPTGDPKREQDLCPSCFSLSLMKLPEAKLPPRPKWNTK